jgi:hypothetical protein
MTNMSSVEEEVNCHNYFLDSSVAMVTRWAAGVRFLAGARDFSVLYSLQTGSEHYPDSYPMGTGVKAAEVCCRPLTSV